MAAALRSTDGHQWEGSTYWFVLVLLFGSHCENWTTLVDTRGRLSACHFSRGYLLIGPLSDLRYRSENRFVVRVRPIGRFFFFFPFLWTQSFGLLLPALEIWPTERRPSPRLPSPKVWNDRGRDLMPSLGTCSFLIRFTDLSTRLGKFCSEFPIASVSPVFWNILPAGVESVSVHRWLMQGMLPSFAFLAFVAPCLLCDAQFSPMCLDLWVDLYISLVSQLRFSWWESRPEFFSRSTRAYCFFNWPSPRCYHAVRFPFESGIVTLLHHSRCGHAEPSFLVLVIGLNFSTRYSSTWFCS